MTEIFRPNVAVFISCLINTLRPSLGFATIRLLENAGCRVHVPRAQTCCGQPAHNAGDPIAARAVARATITALSGEDYIVVPSGSCAAMIKKHYVNLFADDPSWRRRAEQVANRTFEVTTFLVDVLGVETVSAVTWDAVATYHDSCSGLRELGIRDQPRKLLSSVEGLTLIEAKDSESCCGFGGMFSVKYPEISEHIVDTKISRVEATGATLLLGGDLGCLLNIAGRMSRRAIAVDVRHVVEVLAADRQTPPIGAGQDRGWAAEGSTFSGGCS